MFLIVNSYITGPHNIPEKSIVKNKNGEACFVEDYGMGSTHWPIINHPSDAPERHLRDNVLWAKDRMPWAEKNSDKEIPTLKFIISSNGLGRDFGCYHSICTSANLLSKKIDGMEA
jgi:hypothetical protein